MLRLPAFLVVFSVCLSARGAGITTKSLLNDFVDLGQLTQMPSPPYVTKQASSYDRNSTSPDNAATWFANNDVGQYIRVENVGGRKENVMLDAAGPGAVVRIWSANPDGVLRIYIDGNPQPALEAEMGLLLRGKVAPFLPPLGHEVSQGRNLYFPFPYQKSCKITSDKGGFYYHVNYRTYPEGTEVESYSSQKLPELKADIDRVLALLSNPQKANEPGPKHRKTELKLAPAPGQASRVQIKASAGGEVIRLLVLRPSKTDPELLRRAVLTASFDDEETVWSPLGDFFGTAPGINAYESLPLSVSKDGTLTCRWPMPFRKSAVIELRGENLAGLEVTGYALHERLPFTSKSLCFHAKWHAEHNMSTKPYRDWNYVTIDGKGIYAGNTLAVANPVKAWWGEGDEKIYVDGEAFPSHFGTGTEDYYGYAWSSPIPFSHPYHNQTRCDGPGTFGHTSLNRWHIADNIPFTKSFRFDMEIWHWDQNIKMSYATVNFWYAAPGAKDNVAAAKPDELIIPQLPERKVAVVKDAIEGETMKIIEKTGDGVAEAQDMSDFEGSWSRNAHLWWHGAKPGDKLVLSFNAPKAGSYRIVAQLTKAVDYGIHQISVNGSKAGAPADLWHRGVVQADPMDLGIHVLKEMDNRLEFDITGTNEKANPKAYMLGLDYILLKPEK